MVLDAATVHVDHVVQVFEVAAERLFGALQNRFHAFGHCVTSISVAPCIFARRAGTSSLVNENPK